MHIESAELYRLKVPLLRPYHTAFGDLAYIDATVAILRAHDRLGVGESCAVLGYSWESPDDVWDFVKEFSPQMIGLSLNEASTLLRPYLSKRPFGVTALNVALEMLRGDFTLPEGILSFPLVGILNVTRKEEIPVELERLLDEGFSTIKFKVGFDLEEDIKKVQIIQAGIEGRGSLRLDANQNYSFEQALTFAKSIDPIGIELFEQPFPAKEWELMRRFAPRCPLPLMLDESIYGPSEISKAVSFKCAQYIKLKLMKSGGLGNLMEESRQVLEHYMGLVIGNGVATDISCCQEVLVASQLGLKTAGEMNGYLKPMEPLVPGLMAFERGKAIVNPAVGLLPDQRVLNKYAQKQCLRR